MTTSGTPTPAQHPHPWGRRGRHRRPRPRKAALTAGGLALAAGALSLVRLLPESGGDGGYDAAAGPRAVAGGGVATDRSTAPAAARTPIPPEVSPSATSALGGLSGGQGPGDPIPEPSASGAAASATTVPVASNPARTAAPEAPDTSGPPTARTSPTRRSPPTGRPPRPDPPASSPPPTRDTPPAPAPAPAPTRVAPAPDDPGLCVPLTGLCVDLRAGDG